jgi:hypothetical protein
MVERVTQPADLQNPSKEATAMKRVFVITLVLLTSMIFGVSTYAALPAPTNLNCAIVDDSICCDWDDVEYAAKYSLDIEVPVDTSDPADGEADVIVEFSFGTSDRTDGLDMSVSELCVPVSELVYDIDGDLIDDQLTGDAYIKVKALDPGWGKGRQNNPFSDYTMVPLP